MLAFPAYKHHTGNNHQAFAYAFELEAFNTQYLEVQNLKIFRVWTITFITFLSHLELNNKGN